MKHVPVYAGGQGQKAITQNCSAEQVQVESGGGHSARVLRSSESRKLDMVVHTYNPG
jgi:hypothetical protein